jgi:protein TonB
MGGLLEGEERLERELTPEPIFAPATGSVALHGLLVGGLVLYGVLGGFFHHNSWGSQEAGGAIQVTMSSALPLPSDHPPNDNVLATETPSEAPAEPTPKAKQAIDETAIPISGKQKPQEKQTAPKTQQHQPPVKPNNRANYGEQASSSMPRATQSQAASNGPVSVGNGDFGSRFAWYVEVIKRKVDSYWLRPQVDPRTPKGAMVQIYFRVNRQGVPSNFKVNTASGSITLDRSCLAAAERVDSFGVLPAGSNDLWLDVTYDCTY